VHGGDRRVPGTWRPAPRARRAKGPRPRAPPGGAIADAEALYRETIPAWRHLGSRGAIAKQLESFACLALARGDRPRAATIFDAAETLRAVAGAPMLPHGAAECGRAVERLRAEAGAGVGDGGSGRSAADRAMWSTLTSPR
jgi:hypothetical protein